MLANTGCFEGVIAKGISELLKVISSGVLIQDRDPALVRACRRNSTSGPKESQNAFTVCGTSRLRPRRPPSAAKCSYSIWNSDSAFESTSLLYCELVCERGTVRTSATSWTPAFVSRFTNSLIERVECPMVKNGNDMPAATLSKPHRWSAERP